MAHSKSKFDTLQCSVCDEPTLPKKVAAGPIVHYKCFECGTSWRINRDGDQTHFRVTGKGNTLIMRRLLLNRMSKSK